MTARRGVAAAVVVPALALVLTGCTGGTAAGPAEPAGQPGVASTAPVRPASGATLGVEEFAAAITVPGTVVLDVRTPAEFAAGHLEGAQNLDVSSPGFAAALEELDPGTTYAVYCRSGSRSAAALELMLSRGLTNAYHLDGGIGAWSAAGRPTVT